MHYLPTDEKVTDILTKALPNKKLERLRGKPGLVDISSLIEKVRYQIVLVFMG